MALEKYHQIRCDAERTCWNVIVKPRNNQTMICKAYAFFIFLNRILPSKHQATSCIQSFFFVCYDSTAVYELQRASLRVATCLLTSCAFAVAFQLVLSSVFLIFNKQIPTSVTHSAAPREPLFCSYHILTSSVIYY